MVKKKAVMILDKLDDCLKDWRYRWHLPVRGGHENGVVLANFQFYLSLSILFITIPCPSRRHLQTFFFLLTYNFINSHLFPVSPFSLFFFSVSPLSPTSSHNLPSFPSYPVLPHFSSSICFPPLYHIISFQSVVPFLSIRLFPSQSVPSHYFTFHMKQNSSLSPVPSPCHFHPFPSFPS